MGSEESLGQMLRARREEGGLSMEQAAFRCHVPLRLVQILESDDYRLVPDAIYLIRCLHDYARLLGLDPAVLEAGFQESLRRPARPSPVPAWVAPSPPSVSWRHLFWMIGGIAVAVPLLFIALSLSSQRKIEPPVPVAPPAATVTDARRAEEAAMPPTEDPGAQRLAGPPEPVIVPSSPAVAADPPGTREEEGKEGTEERKRRRYLLTAEAREQTWLAVTSDRQERRQVLLRAGERARFTADEGFLVTVGNAGGVTLDLNGARLPLLGGSGEVVRNLSLPDARALLPPPGTSGAGR